MSIQVPAEHERAPTVDRTVVDAPRQRSAVPRLVSWLGLLALFLAVAEGTCRIEDWLRFRTPVLSPITSQADLMVRDRDGIHGRPSARFQKWGMNALGTRGPEAMPHKPPGTVRIVTVGASEAFGLYESPGKEFPRQLEDSLTRRLAGRQCAGGPMRVEVLNAALPGMSLPTIEQDVRNRVRRFEADAILLYPTPAQYLVDDPPEPARPDSSGGASGLSARRALRPRIVDRARNQVKEFLPEAVKTWMRRRETAAYVRDRPPGWRFTSVPSERLAQYDHDLRALIGTIRAMGATPLVATHANAFMRSGTAEPHLLAAWEKFYPRATGPVIVAFDSVARQVTLRAASDSSAPVVDLASSLSTSAGAVFSDFSHFTDHGAALVAAALASTLASVDVAHSACGGR
jgi:hypothetical protein